MPVAQERKGRPRDDQIIEHSEEASNRAVDKQMTLSTISLEPRFITQLVEIIARVVGDEEATVYVFGSRARTTSRPSSDIDLAVKARQKGALLVSRMREALEESTIPYTADVVDLATCDDALTASVQEQGIVVWKS